MPRVSKVVRIAVAPTRSFDRAKVRSVNVVGRPPMPVVQQTFPIVPKPAYFKSNIRRLYKVDVSKGLTMPEALALPFTHGTVAPGTSRYGNVRIMHLQPMVPPKIAGTGNSTRRLIAAPSPTNSAGVRNPYNAKVRVGRRGNNRRFG